MTNKLTPVTQALIAELEILIKNYDHNLQRLENCKAEFEDIYPSACDENADNCDVALDKVIWFWKEHRDKIAFLVWLGDGDVPYPVIPAWSNEVRLDLKWDVHPSAHQTQPDYVYTNPHDPLVKWHVEYVKEGTISGYIRQTIASAGWYWYSSIDDQRTSSMFGPFTSAESAKADCEVAHR